MRPTKKRIRAVHNSLDLRVPEVRINEKGLEHFIRTHSSVSDADIDMLVRNGIVSTKEDGSSCWKLEDVLDAPELYAAYPELRDLPVRYKDFGNLRIHGESFGKQIIINS